MPRATSSRQMRAGPAADGARPAQEQLVIDAFRRIVRELRLAASETSRTAHITAAQLFVLTQLADAPARSLSALGQRTMTDRSSVASAVERLVDRKLVTVATDPKDRRRTTIHITAKGREALRKAPQPPTARLLGGLAALTDADLRSLSASISRLVEAMGLGAAPAPMLFGDDETRRLPGD